MRNKIYSKIEEINIDLDEYIASDPAEGISLLSGISGAILFKYNYYKFFKGYSGDELLEKIEPYIVLLFDQLNTSEYSFTYCDGLAGVAYLLNHLKNDGVFPDEIEDALLEFDAILISKLGKIKSTDDTDLLHGQLGIIYYLTQRPDYTRTRTDFIENTTLFFNDITTEVNSALNGQFEFINCGFAHGYLGYIKILIGLLEIPDFKQPKFTTLLKSLVTIILKYKNLSPDSFALFPSIIRPGQIPENYTINLGWCYGDQPTSLILFEAAFVLNDEDLKKEALSIAATWKERNTIESGFYNGIIDACLCHGTTSAAHFNMKMYRITEDIKFSNNCDYFIEKTIDLGRNQDGASGYLKIEEDGLKKEFSILGGTAGIGLVLIDYATKINTEWDKFLLLAPNSNMNH